MYNSFNYGARGAEASMDGASTAGCQSQQREKDTTGYL